MEKRYYLKGLTVGSRILRKIIDLNIGRVEYVLNDNGTNTEARRVREHMSWTSQPGNA